MKEIIITIDGGEATIETKGFTGKACQLETAALKAALGQTTSETPTAEMRQADTANVLRQKGNG